MVILFNKSGQLCNRLFNIGAFISNARELNHGITCLGFEEYYDLFEPINETTQPYHIKFITKDQSFKQNSFEWQRRIVSKLPRMAALLDISFYDKKGDLNTPSFEKALNHRVCYVVGWPYWDVDRFIKHTPFIKKVFRPKKVYTDKVMAFLQPLKEKYTDIVGVHVRRGDYKEYKNGIYYFDDVFYKEKIIEMDRQLKEAGRNPLFIICSNEKNNIENNFGASLMVSSFNAMEDLVLLSNCNYIFGPPSSFSMWASFYGNVPAIWLSDEMKLMPEDFSPFIAPNTHANGKHIIDYD
jgi:glycosyl transferase family 11